jgi:hypothetical protein
VRVSTLEMWMRLLGGAVALFVAPIIVILIAKVFFGL